MPRGPRAARELPRWLELAAAVLLLALFALACLHFAWTTSPVFDEPGLVYSGYTAFKTGAVKSQTGNLIFAQAWSALPLFAMDLAVPTMDEIKAVEPAKRELGRLFVFHQGNDWRAIIRASRVMVVLLGLALCFTVYRWSRRLFGPIGGLISLVLCCFSPLVLANSSMATTDLAVTLWFLLAVGAWWALLHRVSLGNLVLSGVALGLLLITKVSGLLFLPMALILLVVRLAATRPLAVEWPRRAPRQISGLAPRLITLFGAGAASALVALVVIWLAYAVPTAVLAQSGASLAWEQSFSGKPGGALSAIVSVLRELHVLPESYLFDLRLFDATSSVRRGYLLGEYSLRGWWYFFPVAMWFKTPIAAMLLIALGVSAILWRMLGRQAATGGDAGEPAALDLYELTPLIVLALAYLGASLTTSLNIGIRHVLPVSPPLFIVAGAAALPPFHRSWGRGVVAALVLWSAIEAWQVHPQYLAYFNQLGGGPENGHRILVDSSYEWGQDLPAVEEWLRRRSVQSAAKPPVYFAYFGNADLARFDIDAVLLPQEYELRPIRIYPLAPGTYIVSATMLHTVYGPAMGPWRPRYERLYQELSAEVARLAPWMADEDSLRRLVQQEGAARLAATIRTWDALRFVRLAAYLRQRQPDARISHGMLVFELTREELTRALEGPPAELKPDDVIRGTEGAAPNAFDFVN